MEGHVWKLFFISMSASATCPEMAPFPGFFLHRVYWINVQILKKKRYQELDNSEWNFSDLEHLSKYLNPAMFFTLCHFKNVLKSDSF